MSNATIVETSASGKDIQALVSKLEPVLANEPVDHVIITLIAMSLVIMNPNITPAQLQAGLSEVGQFMSMLVATMNGEGDESASLPN